MHRLRASADSEEAARADLLRQAKSLSTGGSSALSPSSTIADVVQLWLSQILTRANTGSLSYSTYESYETTARVIIVPWCGGVRLEQLTVGRCDRILQKILEEETISKARRARAVLSLVCGYAVRDDVLDRNPVRDVQRLPMAPRKETPLSTTQIIGIRELMEQWRITRDDGPDPTIAPCSTEWKSCSEPRCGSENASAYAAATWT
ncbi:MAG: integrase [Mycetocola sp.]|nr:integrase [Mycetocola sp.]